MDSACNRAFLIIVDHVSEIRDNLFVVLKPDNHLVIVLIIQHLAALLQDPLPCFLQAEMGGRGLGCGRRRHGRRESGEWVIEVPGVMQYLLRWLASSSKEGEEVLYMGVYRFDKPSEGYTPWLQTLCWSPITSPRAWSVDKPCGG